MGVVKGKLEKLAKEAGFAKFEEWDFQVMSLFFNEVINSRIILDALANQK